MGSGKHPSKSGGGSHCVSLRAIFDPTVSPRNMALVAIRR